jgi:hypothetical protein
VTYQRTRPLLVKIANRIGRLGLWIFTPVLGRGYSRFLRLRSLAERAFEQGNETEAASLATELLKVAETYRDDWNYGNAVHAGHTLLGRIALRSKKPKEASQHLLLAGRTLGSPQLNSFGPNMRLAMELINAGEVAAVLQYFDLCREFWKMGNDRLDLWSAEVVEGKQPNFGANLAC